MDSLDAFSRFLGERLLPEETAAPAPARIPWRHCDGAHNRAAHRTRKDVAVIRIPGGRTVTVCPSCHVATQTFWQCVLPPVCLTCGCCTVRPNGDCEGGLSGERPGRCHADQEASADAPADSSPVAASDPYALATDAPAHGPCPEGCPPEAGVWWSPGRILACGRCSTEVPIIETPHCVVCGEDGATSEDTGPDGETVKLHSECWGVWRTGWHGLPNHIQNATGRPIIRTRIQQTFRICHPDRRCSAPGFIRCACDPTPGRETVCGAHYAHVTRPEHPDRQDYETIAEYLAAREAYRPPVCDASTVCPGVPAAPVVTFDPADWEPAHQDVSPGAIRRRTPVQDAPDQDYPDLTRRTVSELRMCATVTGADLSDLIELQRSRMSPPATSSPADILDRCPGCDVPCDGTGRFPGGRVCRWCQEAGHCTTVAAPPAGPVLFNPDCGATGALSTFHYDIRLVCSETGQLEATEDNGYTDRARAERNAATFHEFSRYRIVACDRPGTDPVHDVDLSYWRHHNGHTDAPVPDSERYVGRPGPFDWERDQDAPDARQEASPATLDAADIMARIGELADAFRSAAPDLPYHELSAIRDAFYDASVSADTTVDSL